MPFYEYVCTACGEPTEVLQRLSDPPETECPHCHQQSLIKQVSAAGFRLKGGGWYETDFKSGNKRNLEGDSAVAPPAAVKGESKSEGAADAKPASETAAPKADAKPAPAKSDAATPAPAAPKASDSKSPA